MKDQSEVVGSGTFPKDPALDPFNQVKMLREQLQVAQERIAELEEVVLRLTSLGREPGVMMNNELR